MLSRRKKTDQGLSGGQTVDVSIMERYGLRYSDDFTYLHDHLRASMLNLMEGIVPEYDRKGKVCINEVVMNSTSLIDDNTG